MSLLSVVMKMVETAEDPVRKQTVSSFCFSRVTCYGKNRCNIALCCVDKDTRCDLVLPYLSPSEVGLRFVGKWILLLKSTFWKDVFFLVVLLCKALSILHKVFYPAETVRHFCAT